MNNRVVQDKDGQYVVVNGTAKSVERYTTYEEAQEDARADDLAHANALVPADADDISPITWQ